MWFLTSSFFFFPRLISPVADWMSTILLHMALLSANLGCRSETCCMRLAENTGRKNRQKIAICAPSHNFMGQFTTKSRIDNREKLVKQQYRFHMCSQYGELWPTSGWDRFGCLEHPSKFKRFSLLDFVTAATSLKECQQNFARCLAVSWAGS